MIALTAVGSWGHTGRVPLCMSGKAAAERDQRETDSSERANTRSENPLAKHQQMEEGPQRKPGLDYCIFRPSYTIVYYIMRMF